MPTEQTAADLDVLGEFSQRNTQAAEMIRRHEGVGPHGFDRVYPDSEGVPTAGHGINLEELSRRTGRALPLAEGARINPEVLEGAFQFSLMTAEKDAASFAGPGWAGLPPQKQDALKDMAFQLGGTRLRKFKDSQILLRAAIEGKASWESVRMELLNSKWARQTPNRATEISSIIGAPNE